MGGLVGPVRLAEGLWRWLRRVAEPGGGPNLPEYLPNLPTIERLRVIAAGGDPDISAAQGALLLLAVARDGVEKSPVVAGRVRLRSGIRASSRGRRVRGRTR